MQNRKYFLGLLIILFTINGVYAQVYWQQEVNYTIEVRLNDQTNELNGHEAFLYKNNSPDTLSVIYMHLWPNAYKDRTSALNQQKIKTGDVDFHYADEKDRGFIDSLSFTANGKTLKLTPFSTSNDIALLELNEALLPGDSLLIQTPFHVKIPANYSRLGHVGQSYQITQWYPKPAVYDQSGWHPLAYLDQGEFYSEFGSFKVQITLPENYVVGATGVLQEQSEIDFLDQLSRDSILPEKRIDHLQFPASSSKMKTITYVQDHIHDFGWFADKRFYVRKGEVELPKSKRKVTTWVMYTASQARLWQKGIEYINRSVLFYSEQVGEYPYDFCTAIDGTISAGGGMEYPMVTCIGSASSAYELDIVIAHEVGHNWFYGILGSNERDHPWMDEGINSFYEAAYSSKYYPDMKLYESILGNRFIAKLLGAEKIRNNYDKKLFYLYSAARNKDQPNELTSEAYSTLNYGSIVYSKTVLILQQLKSFMGSEAFDMAMHDFYQQYMFKHVSPEDFKTCFSKYAKQDLSWFFNDFLNSTKKQKITIAHIKNRKDGSSELLIVNKGSTQSPIPVTLKKEDGSINVEWYQMPEKRLIVDLNRQNLRSVEVLQDNDNINLSGSSNTAINKNNRLHLLHPVDVKMIGLLRTPCKQQLNILPALAWNNGDKWMLGLLFYSSLIPAPKFEYAIAPMFGFGSTRPVGVFKLAYHIYPSWAESITFKLNGQSFSYHDYYNVSRQKTFAAEYYSLAYNTTIAFKNKSANSNIHKSLSGRASMVYESFENDFYKGKKEYHFYNTNELTFQWKNSRKINPYNFAIALQQGKDFMTLSSTANFYVSYNKAKSYIRFRFFAATFLYQKNAVIDINKGLLPPNRSLTMSSNGAVGNYLGRNNEDFTYDAIYLDRAGMDPVLSHQVFTNKEGGFRSMIGTGLGNSNRWLLSMNISAKLPKRIPLKPFITVGTGYLFNEKLNKYTSANFLAEAGFSIVVLEDIFEIHFPLLITNNIRKNQNFHFGIDKFYERITFTLDLNLLNPFEKIKNLKF